MSDTFGLSSGQPLMRYDQSTSCWRTCEATSLWDLAMSSPTFPEWGTLLDGVLYERQMSGLVINEREFSSLPTPMAVDGTKMSSNPKTSARRMEKGRQESLTDIVQTKLLPTPMVNDVGAGKTIEWWDDWVKKPQKTGLGKGRPINHGNSLEQEMVRLLPTPRAQNAEARNQNIWERPLDQPQNLENTLARLPIGENMSQQSESGSLLADPLQPQPSQGLQDDQDSLLFSWSG